MLITSASDTENNTWKRKAKQKAIAVAIVKVWELNDFAVRLT